MREAILVMALVFIAALGYLTLSVAVRDGPDVLTVLSGLVLALFAFGIVGALRHPPDD
jgi:hypothetical protein